MSKDVVVTVITFTAYLSVTIKRLTRYNQKVALAAMLEGKSMPSNMAANTNHTTLLKNQSAIKYLPQMCFLSNEAEYDVKNYADRGGCYPPTGIHDFLRDESNDLP